MMYYNYQKLLGKMKECGVTQEELASLVGISPASLNKKLTNKSQFRQNEMRSVLAELGVDLADIADYFFKQ